MSLGKALKTAIGKRVAPRYLRAAGQMLAWPERLRFHPAARRLWPSENHRRLAALKDRHRGERCFVIGSGPSINQMDLEPLRREITFGFNAFFLVAERLGFLPTYYLVEDPLPAEDNASELNRLEGTTKILPWDLRYCLRPDASTVYVHFDRCYSDHPEPGFPRFSPNAARVVFWGGTVAYMALQLAFYMGFEKVYLLGIDLTYQVPANLDGPVIVSSTQDGNHFHPQYFGPGKRWHDPKVERMQASFEAAEVFFRNAGRELRNATVGGNLQRVPRVDFASLFV